MRVLLRDGEPWFVAVDACSVLFDAADVKMYGPSCRITHLDADEKYKMLKAELVSRELITLQQKTPCMTFISESGLYKLVMRSDKPEARAFQDWVTREVLPTIRKTGTYSVHDLSVLRSLLRGLRLVAWLW